MFTELIEFIYSSTDEQFKAFQTKAIYWAILSLD